MHFRRNDIYVLLIIITLTFLSVLLIYINTRDFNPNTVIIKADLQGYQYEEPQIFFNYGYGFDETSFTSGEIISGLPNQLKSLRIDIYRQPILTNEDFILEEYYFKNGQETTTWFAYLPRYNREQEADEAYLLVTVEPEAAYQLYVDGINWSLKRYEGFLLASNPDLNSKAPGNVVIGKTLEHQKQRTDISSLVPGVESILAFKKEISPLKIESVELARHINRLNISLPVITWEAEDVYKYFKIIDARNYTLSDSLLQITPDVKLRLRLEYQGSSTEIDEQIATSVFKYRVWLNLVAFLIALICFFIMSLSSGLVCSCISRNSKLNKSNASLKNIFKIFSRTNKAAFFRPVDYYSLLFVLSIFVLILPFQMSPLPAIILNIAILIFFALSTLNIKNNFIQGANNNEWNYCQPWYKRKQFINVTVLLFAILIAFTLRFINLNILDPYTDEYKHLVAAKDFIDNGHFDYTRAILVTRLVAMFYQLGNAESFYEYLFWGRIPGVIISSLTVIPIFLLTRRISYPVALLSAFLWATSPWAIGVAKTIREYAYYPFFILFAGYFLVRGLELVKERKIKKMPQGIIYIIPAALLSFYAFFIDTSSTLQVSAVIFFSIFLSFYFANIKIDISNENKPYHYLALLIIVIIAASMFFFASKISHITLTNINFTPFWLQVFFDTNAFGVPLHWWGEHHLQYVGVFFVFSGLIIAIIKNNSSYILNFTVFVLLLIFYSFFFDRYARPRYIFYALPYFVPLVAMSIYAMTRYVQRIRPLIMKMLLIPLITILFVQAFNMQSIFYPLRSNHHGYIRTTDEHHDQLGSTSDFLNDKISEKDVFITTIFRGKLVLDFDVPQDRIYHFSYADEERFDMVSSIVSENEQGFMILDWRRNGFFAEGYPLKGSFLVNDTLIKLVFNRDGMQVYRWEK